jgi:hypothetical protein
MRNNEINDDNTWEEIKQKLDNGGSNKKYCFEYNDYYNVNKSKICDYFYNILVEKKKKKFFKRRE